MSRAGRVRQVAQRAIGTPDASALAEILERFQTTLDDLQARITQLESAVDERNTETQSRLDLLRSVALEHSAILDQLSTRSESRDGPADQ
jgi:uncharacterized coiled-coil DUF342 family protein